MRAARVIWVSLALSLLSPLVFPGSSFFWFGLTQDPGVAGAAVAAPLRSTAEPPEGTGPRLVLQERGQAPGGGRPTGGPPGQSRAPEEDRPLSPHGQAPRGNGAPTSPERSHAPEEARSAVGLPAQTQAPRQGGAPAAPPQRSGALEGGGWGGQARARSWRACNMTYTTTPKEALFLVSDSLKLTYVLMSKSGSSTIRATMGTKTNTKPNWNYTVFTVVRDPLERIVSYFFYTYLDMIRKRHALQLFDEETARLVHGQAGHAHGQRSVPLGGGHHYDFVGTLETLATDWAQLGELQKQRFGIPNWPPLAPKEKDNAQRYRPVFTVSTLPANISQRVCNIYRDDYCCFQLPVPPACQVDCAGGLPV